MFFSDLCAIFHQFEKKILRKHQTRLFEPLLSAKSDNSVAGNQLVIQYLLSKQRA